MRKIIGGAKDEQGIFVKEQAAPTPAPESTDISIDDLMRAGLQAIKGTMKAIMSDVNTGMPSRETVMNLKDVMGMLKELKKEERELLDNMTDEQLEKMLKNDK